jgi:plastocyanin
MRSIQHRSLPLVAVAVAGLALAGGGWPAAAKPVNGTVGPGFTIGLTAQGKKVTKLQAGATYRFVISDRSSGHNFRLTGPRFNRELTGVGYTGTKTFVLKLRKGTYRFLCDPHASVMNGRFLVS